MHIQIFTAVFVYHLTQQENGSIGERLVLVQQNNNQTSLPIAYSTARPKWMNRALTLLRSSLLYRLHWHHIRFSSLLAKYYSIWDRIHVQRALFVILSLHTKFWGTFFLLFTALPLETSYEYHEKRRYMYYTLVIVFDTRFKNRISIRRLFSDFYHGLESLRLHKAAHGILPLLTKMLMLN